MRQCPDLRLLTLPREDPNAACLPQGVQTEKSQNGEGKREQGDWEGLLARNSTHFTGNSGKPCISWINYDASSLLQPSPKWVNKKFHCFYFSEFGYTWSVPSLFRESRARKGFSPCLVWPLASATLCSGSGFAWSVGSWASHCASLSLSSLVVNHRGRRGSD